MDKIVVIKLGGSTLGGETGSITPDTTLEDLLRLVVDGFLPIVVHGGGNAINSLLQRLGQEPRFQNGVRITDPIALEAATMVLRGQISTELVAAINAASPSVKAVGLSGVDGRLLVAQRDISQGDIGLVGETVSVNADLLQLMLSNGLLPVISSLGTAQNDPDTKVFNINADNAAASIAAALQAERCVFLTNVPGVRDAEDKPIARLERAAAFDLIERGVIWGGMLPKINAALRALEGAAQVLIIDGREPHALYEAVAENRVNGTIFIK